MIKKLKDISRYARFLYSQKLINQVAQLLKEERVKQNLSHEKIADIAAVHRTAVGHIENGTRKPSLFVFIKLARALNMKPSELLRRAEEKLSSDSRAVEECAQPETL